MKWRERRRREQAAKRSPFGGGFRQELPAILEQRNRDLLAKGGPPHPEIPFDPRRLP